METALLGTFFSWPSKDFLFIIYVTITIYLFFINYLLFIYLFIISNSTSTLLYFFCSTLTNVDFASKWKWLHWWFLEHANQCQIRILDSFYFLKLLLNLDRDFFKSLFNLYLLYLQQSLQGNPEPLIPTTVRLGDGCANWWCMSFLFGFFFLALLTNEAYHFYLAIFLANWWRILFLFGFLFSLLCYISSFTARSYSVFNYWIKYIIKCT